ncbi:MAG: patatin-like protein, partial [Gemmatimonadota bacterium]
MNATTRPDVPVEAPTSGDPASAPEPAEGSGADPDRPVALDPTREVRFAVVMYGGVSLAIYIHGVSRELLNLVRATAPSEHGGGYARRPGSPVEAVYRKLGQMLVGGRAATDAWEVRDGRAVHRGGEEPPIRTRFVVDVISGTSAGGINGVYLAKALANDQGLDALSDLWVREGDIGVLLNDDGSRDPSFRSPAETSSLLNGHRMYFKLLDALDRMDRDAGGPGDRSADSPLVDELDLYVTATDLNGLPVTIQLSDAAVSERRHRNVFHFVYANAHAAGPDRRADFRFEDNPFLAFAARCTSAFPAAFDPMRLADLESILGREGRRRIERDQPGWRRFFSRYDPSSFGTVAFADGGYLDNKPFTYATETLTRRREDTLVDRKLLYVEPAPELLDESEGEGEERPDVLDNLGAAITALPRYETIREDLERVLERNRRLERVRKVLRDRDEDVRQLGGDPSTLGHEAWLRRDLRTMIETHGVAYGAYHRLRVATVLDELAGLIARIAGLAMDSVHYQAVRELTERWKNARFATYRDGDDGLRTENEFLFHYDYSWWLRRLRFTHRKLNEIGEGGAEKERLIRFALDRADAEAVMGLEAGDRAVFEETLRNMRRGLSEVFAFLRREGRRLRSRNPERNGRIHAAVRDLGLDPADVAGLLTVEGQARDERARELLGPDLGKLDGLGTALKEELTQILVDAAHGAELVLGLSDAAMDGSLPPGLRTRFQDLAAQPADSPGRLAQRSVAYYYRHFEYYDMIAFPVVNETDIGEADVVDVFRVSPRDATALVDEGGSGRRKLAGTALGNFGAFLVEDWRRNDLLWGRLDGAERIVCALLPDAAVERDPAVGALREALIGELHEAILAEVWAPRLRTAFYPVLGESLKAAALDRTLDGRTVRARLHAWLGQMESSGRVSPSAIDDILRTYVGPDNMREFFVHGCDVDRRFPPEPTVTALARGTRVMGRILDRLATRYEIQGRPVAWITRATEGFWRLVQVAVPDSLTNKIARHFLGMLYAFELFLIVVGTVLSSDMARFGTIALALTAAAHLAMVLLGRFLRRRRLLA